jgi:chromosome partitioning protein
MMKKILVVNPKGGCGKTTLATNLASYYALWEVPVAIIDYDSQNSALDWVAQRPKDLNIITAVDGSRGRVSIDSGIKRVLMDAPARTGTPQLKKLFGLADVVIVPVLPSPIDIRAAGNFIETLKEEGISNQTRIGLIGNRVKEQTLIYKQLKKFLRKADAPVVSHIRDTQNYIRAAEGGFGIFEMPPYLVAKDIEQWRPVINWIEAK